MKTTAEMIEVMQAFENGETIQFLEKGISGEYVTFFDLEPTWDWYSYDYRVKPKTKTVELHWMVFEKNSEIYTSNPRSLIEHREFKKDLLDSGAKILRTYCEMFEVPLGD